MRTSPVRHDPQIGRTERLSAKGKNPWARWIASWAFVTIMAMPAWALAQVRSSNAEGLWQRGERYYVEKDYRDAYPYLLQAAQMGHPRAQALLGIMYQDGKGMPENDREAEHWFALAAAQGHRASQYEMGAMYEDGEGGLPTDLSKAAHYYSLSAHQGFYKAQTALGLSYEFGEGVPRNRQTAIYWLDQTAAQGDGMSHWIADWLRRPDTPHFQTEAQLGTYIGTKVQQHYFGGGGSPGGRNALGLPCSNPVSCANMMENIQKHGSAIYHGQD